MFALCKLSQKIGNQQYVAAAVASARGMARRSDSAKNLLYLENGLFRSAMLVLLFSVSFLILCQLFLDFNYNFLDLHIELHTETRISFLVMFFPIDENIFRASSSKVICSFPLVPVYINEHSFRHLADSLEVLKCLRSKNNYIFRIFEKLCTFSIE